MITLQSAFARVNQKKRERTAAPGPEAHRVRLRRWKSIGWMMVVALVGTTWSLLWQFERTEAAVSDWLRMSLAHAAESPTRTMSGRTGAGFVDRLPVRPDTQGFLDLVVDATSASAVEVNSLRVRSVASSPRELGRDEVSAVTRGSYAQQIGALGAIHAQFDDLVIRSLVLSRRDNPAGIEASIEWWLLTQPVR